MVALFYRFMGFGLVVNWADAEWERFPFSAYDEITERHQQDIFTLLLAGDFAIKAGESDGKGLYGTQRIPIVQSEGIVCYSPKLHHNVVLWNVAQKRVMQWLICLANIPVLTRINILHVFYNIKLFRVLIGTAYFTAYTAHFVLLLLQIVKQYAKY